jgi:hypothetical protein
MYGRPSRPDVSAPTLRDPRPSHKRYFPTSGRPAASHRFSRTRAARPWHPLTLSLSPSGGEGIGIARSLDEGESEQLSPLSVRCFIMALRIVSNLRMHAVRATFLGLPAASRRSYSDVAVPHVSPGALARQVGPSPLVRTPSPPHPETCHRFSVSHRRGSVHQSTKTSLPAYPRFRSGDTVTTRSRSGLSPLRDPVTAIDADPVTTRMNTGVSPCHRFPRG